MEKGHMASQIADKKDTLIVDQSVRTWLIQLKVRTAKWDLMWSVGSKVWCTSKKQWHNPNF